MACKILYDNTLYYVLQQSLTFQFFNWDVYFENVFTHTEVFVNPDEKIIVREPEYFDGLQQVLQTLTPQAQGKVPKYIWPIHLYKIVF